MEKKDQSQERQETSESVPKDNTNTPAVSVKNEMKRLSRFIIALNIGTIILLLLAIFIAVTKYFVFINQIKKIGVIEQLQNIKVTTTQLQNIQTKQQIELQNIMESINKIHQHKELLPIAEAYSAAKTANMILLTRGDTKTAIELLQTAQQEISPIPTLNLAKQTLGKDITNLQVYVKFSDEALILKLDEIMQKINNLPQTTSLTLSAKNQNTENQTTIASHKNSSVWYNFTESLQQALKNIIIVQHNKYTTPPLLPSEQLINLRLNIQFKLMQAEWAIMYKKPNLYKLCLKEAETWIRAYFPENILKANNILAPIQELQSISFQEKVPDINNTVIALKNVLSQLLAQNLTQLNMPSQTAPQEISPKAKLLEAPMNTTHGAN